jgi:hypothetical protein
MYPIHQLQPGFLLESTMLRSGRRMCCSPIDSSHPLGGLDGDGAASSLWHCATTRCWSALLQLDEEEHHRQRHATKKHMLNVHRARLMAGGHEGCILCTIVVSVMSLMIMCGLLSVVPIPRALDITKTYIIIGVSAIMLLLILAGWVMALHQICACEIRDAATR